MLEEATQNNERTEQENTQPTNEDLKSEFQELRKQFEKTIAHKDEEIETLKQKIKDAQNEAKENIKDLTDEAKERLKLQEDVKQLNDYSAKLEHDKATAQVDAHIKEGKLLPKQRETAIKLAITDFNAYSELYANAEPVIQIDEAEADKFREQKKRFDDSVAFMRDYFKD